MTEEQWLRQVIDLAGALGWRSYHVDRSAKRVVRRSGFMVWASNVNRQGKGFPDLVLVRERDARLIFAELKTDDGRVEPEQRDWLAALTRVADRARSVLALAGAGASSPSLIEVRLWRPRDYALVERDLR